MSAFSLPLPTRALSARFAMAEGLSGLARALRIVSERGTQIPLFQVIWFGLSVLVRSLDNTNFATTPALLGSVLVAQAASVVPLAAIPQGERVRRRRGRTTAYVSAVVLSSLAATTAFWLLFGLHLGNTLPFAAAVGITVDGITFVLIVHFAFVIVVHLGREHSLLTERRNALTGALVRAREDWDALISEQRGRATEETQEALLPILAGIAEASRGSGGESVESLVSGLRSMIQDRLKPLTRGLSLELAAPLAAPEDAVTRRMAALPRSVDLHQVIRPEFMILLPMPAYVVNMMVVYGSRYWLAFIATAILGYFAWRVLLFCAPTHEVSRWTAVAWAFVGAFPVAVASGVFLWGIVTITGGDAPGVPAMIVRQLGLAPLYNVALAYMFALTVSMPRERALLERAQQDLAARSRALHRDAWIVSREWVLHLHGTVQTLLTAALIVAERTPVDWPRAQALVEAAIAELRNGPTPDRDMDALISALIDSWAGVCSARVSVDPAARRTLARNPLLVPVVNEVLKEALSNAVRHGGVSQWSAQVRLSGHDLLIDCSGAPDRTSSGVEELPGLGTALYDEVADEWHREGSQLRLRMVVEE